MKRPIGLAGLVEGEIPVSTLHGTVLQTPCTSGPCNALGPLFPYQTGYSVGAGNCSSEVVTHHIHVTSVPGTKVIESPTANLPMGLLNLMILKATGEPDAGATVSLKISTTEPTTCTRTWTLAASATGSLNVSTIYASYKISVGGTTVGTFTVEPTSVISPIGATTAVHQLPYLIVVKL